jgi:hypothetical protein
LQPLPPSGPAVSGQWSSLVFLAVLAAVVLFWTRRARSGRPVPRIRPLASLEAMDEAVGRATEMGRPVHMTSGIGTVASPQVIASFPVLQHLARSAARLGTRLVATSADVVTYAVQEEVVRQGYLEAGRPHRFRPEDVRFLTDSQFAYAAGVTGIFRRERPAANVLYGSFAAEAMVLIEAGAEAGALQIAGTADLYQLPFFVAGCDWTLIGEEMYAASAYLSRDPVLVGTVVGQDWAKLLIVGLLLAGVVLANVVGPAHPLAGWLRW